MASLMKDEKHYTKDLTHIQTVRLSPKLLDQSIRCADTLGISVSDFIRQSLNRNIAQSLGTKVVYSE
jgi:hypothetical protein